MYGIYEEDWDPALEAAYYAEQRELDALWIELGNEAFYTLVYAAGYVERRVDEMRWGAGS